MTGAQAGIDPERIDAITERLETVYVVMQPGDLLLFHPNTLHRSDQNTSENPRWSLICCYNAARNSPYKESHHPAYTKLHKIEDAQILDYADRQFSVDDKDALMAGEVDKSVEWLEA